MIDSKGDKVLFIREEALRMGFDSIGFSKAEHLPEQASRLTDWLKNKHQGEMHYMENHFDLRTDPRQLVEGAKSVISLTFNYYTEKKQLDPKAPIISKYAFGRDYHKVLKKKLFKLLDVIREPLGIGNARAFVDSGPVLERTWAQRAGLGWIGKNTMLIHPKKGSYFFLCELIVDVELEYDEAMTDHCGRCRRCIDACPTKAIHPDGYVMDGSRCISYATIEKKGSIPDSFHGKMENRVFGCDICIEVCPWNKFAKEQQEADFRPKEEMLRMTREEWENMDEEKFEYLFNGTPVRRTGFEGLKRNVEALTLKL